MPHRIDTLSRIGFMCEFDHLFGYRTHSLVAACVWIVLPSFGTIFRMPHNRKLSFKFTPFHPEFFLMDIFS